MDFGALETVCRDRESVDKCALVKGHSSWPGGRGGGQSALIMWTARTSS